MSRNLAAGRSTAADGTVQHRTFGGKGSLMIALVSLHDEGVRVDVVPGHSVDRRRQPVRLDGFREVVRHPALVQVGGAARVGVTRENQNGYGRELRAEVF